jgi:type II secretory pathway pseudopilin PulG
MQFGPYGRNHAAIGGDAGARLVRQAGFSLIDILMVVALAGVICAVALPVTGSAVAGQRFKSDAQALANLVGLAKMRASAGYTRARVRANVAGRTFVLERWDKTASAWIAEGGELRLSPGITFGYASLGTPPANTQASIGLSPACRTALAANSAAITDTSCVVFNSRGLPVDAGGVVYGGHAIYITDGHQVAATTITATPRIRRWWSVGASASWRELQ